MKKENRKNRLNNIAKYSGMGFQMLAIMLAGVYGGIKLDEYLELSFPVFTLVLTIVAVIFAIYFIIKDFLK